MAELVNLNRYRKAKMKEAAGRRAEENRAKHGVAKTKREAIERERDKLKSELDGKQLD